MTPGDSVPVPSSRIPVSARYDVVVCGGGPAGIAAAVAAARRGPRTLLVEQLAHLGGMGCAGFVNAWCDTQVGPIANELEARMTALGSARRTYDPERHLCSVGRLRFEADMMAVIALQMVREAGADVLLCTVAEAAWRPQGGPVAGVFVVNKGGRSLITAGTVVDATADGDLATGAGARVMQGDPEDGRIQHVNYRFRMAGIDRGQYQREKPDPQHLAAAVEAARRNGQLHPPSGVFRPPEASFPFHPPSGELIATGWEIEGVDPTDPESISRCLCECQLAALEVVAFCRAHLPGYQRCRIERLPGLLGTRESRRIVGDYILTRDDVIAGRKFEDGIAQCCFFVDLHDSPPGVSIPFPMSYKRETMPPPGDWYEIPYRCLIPVGVPGLLVAGRCISCDRSAQGSMRLQPTCMFLGEAAGIGAAHALRDSLLPGDVDGKAVRAEMGLG